VGPVVKIGNPPRKPPSLRVNTPAVQGSCVTLTGTATGETSLQVYTRLDGGVVPGNWLLANWDGRTGAFTQRNCELDAGEYGADAMALDQLGATANISFTGFVITRPNYDQSVTATLTDHVAQQRVTSYMSCLGFGTCDTIYNTLLSRYGSSTPFTVYRQTSTTIWYEVVNNIPPSIAPPVSQL